MNCVAFQMEKCNRKSTQGLGNVGVSAGRELFSISNRVVREILLRLRFVQKPEGGRTVSHADSGEQALPPERREISSVSHSGHEPLNKDWHFLCLSL